MDEVARWPPSERANLFTEAGARLGLAPLIIEKDFWVCWTLKRLFSLQGNPPPLVFKGGTSLSKIFGVIRRFSEDIDLSFDRKALGYTDEKMQDASSRKKRERLVESLDADVAMHIDRVLMPTLDEAIGTELLVGSREKAWTLIKDDTDPRNVFFHYPPGLSAGGLAYVAPLVRLELGARGDFWPTAHRPITSYAAETFPDLFKVPACDVTVLTAERTFWEKATILHADNHRSADKPELPRRSRHCYDFALLADSSYGESAMAQPDLLEKVVEHKKIFFPAAGYDTARLGSLRLVPRDDRLPALTADYVQMKEMIFDQPPPTFDDLLARIAEVEGRINAAQ